MAKLRTQLAMAAPDVGPTMDEHTLTDLIRDFSAPLHRYVIKLTLNDRQLAEDIVQETLVRAWQRPNILNHRYSSIRPWLFTVARNLVSDHWRAKRVRPTEVGDAELQTVAEETDEIDKTVLAHAVGQAVARLSSEHREVLARVYYRGMSIVDAATELGIPAGTVKSRTFYALRSLRLILDELGLAGTA